MGVRLKKRVIEVGNQAIVPKEITINGHSQKPDVTQTINIGEEKIIFDKKATVDWHYLDGKPVEPVSWKENRQYRAAVLTGAAGGAGGAGGSAVAVSRINVIDPHLVLMMRDVMDSGETAARLRVGPSAGGGGGGGAVTSTSAGGASAEAGWTPNAGPGTDSEPNMYDSSVATTVSHSIGTAAGQSGGAGGAGVDSSNTQGQEVLAGGAGGGGAGGNGGAVVIITTSDGISASVTGGEGGAGGARFSGAINAESEGGDGNDGRAGSSVVIRV